MKKLKFKFTFYINSLCDELRSIIDYRKNKPRTPKLKKLCSFILSFSLLIYTFLGLFGFLKASAADVPIFRGLDATTQTFSYSGDRVTDLTGYTVTIPEGWSSTSAVGEFDIDGLFSFANTTVQEGLSRLAIGYTTLNFSVVEPASNSIAYAIGGRYLTDLAPSVSFIITVSGGTDVSNPDLISWLFDNNATFTKADRITDLTGYTITVPSGWTTPSGLIENVGVSGKFSSSFGSDLPFSILRLGYASDEGFLYASEDIVSFDNYNLDGLDLTYSSFSLTELSGNVTNSQFIQWLYDNNATFTGGDEPEVTYNLSGAWTLNEVPSFPSSGSSITQRDLSYRVNIDSSILNILDISSTSINFGYGQSLDGSLYYSGGWADDYDRVITFEGEQTVSEDFYNWFTSNASQNQNPDVPVLLTGDFVFDSNIFPDGVPSMWSQSLNFVSDGVSYTLMANDGGLLEYGSTSVYNHDVGGWLDDSYRYVSLSNNAVPLWFYQWFNSVTSPYTPLPSSSLEGLYFVSNTAIESSSEITFVRPFLSNSQYFNTIYFTNAISGDMISFVDSNNYQIVVWSEGSGWLEPQYSVILFDTSVIISGEDYNIFSSYYTSLTNDSNLNLLYNAGLENGRSFGYSEGFSDGESSALGNSFMGNFFGGIIDALDALTLFGSISVLDIIQGVLGLFIALWVLKLIAGG